VGALLISQWLGGEDTIDIRDEASIAVVREAVRKLGAAQGLDKTAAEALATAASELGHNQLDHARGGEMLVRAVRRGEVPGVEVVAADRGEGIVDPTLAIQGQDKTPTGLGVGFSGVYRLVHEIDADVRWGEGSCLWARRFAEPVRRSEVAILGRPHPDQNESGDHGGFVRTPEALVVGVVDGLGHGRPARDAADVAMKAFYAASARPLVELLEACSAAMVPTRGAVMAVARLDISRRTLEHAGAGNITSRIFRRDGRQEMFASTARVLGGGTRAGRLRAETGSLAADDTLLLYTDGLRSRTEIVEPRELMRQPALVIAHRLIRDFAREHDDALVLVAR